MEKNMNMFFITCFSKMEKNKLGWLDIGSTRVFGFKESFEKAKLALNENSCDMHEFLYIYALVEEMGPYIHPDVENRWFFKWDGVKEGFFEASEPELLKTMCNFALG